MERLQKVLARHGLGSRRHCEALISEGRVRVDGRVAHLGQTVAAEACRIEVDGRPLSGPETLVYLALHKPRHCITSVHDPEGRPTVMQFVAHVPQRIYPIGRLDFDSEGLLLLTNDGALAHALMHPSHRIDKAYEVEIEAPLTSEALSRLRQGVNLEDGRTSPAEVRPLGPLRLSIRIHEGRNRQVRRMIAAVGGEVLRLIRRSVGPIELAPLSPGEVRTLTPAEVRALQKLCKRGL